MNLFIRRAGGWVPLTSLCSPDTHSHLWIRGVIICESPPSCRTSIQGLMIIIRLSGAQEKRVVTAVTHTLMDLQGNVILQWVHKPHMHSYPSGLIVVLKATRSQGFAAVDGYGADELLKCTPYAAGSSPYTHILVLSLFSCRTCP